MTIPKFKGAVRVEDFGSIALCNCVYKIISKIMVFRRQDVLPPLLIAQDVMDGFSRENQEVTCLKMDLSKAYHRVSWPFLEPSMEV